MRKTPQQFRRENIKKLFIKILKDQKTQLTPISILASESLDDDFTTTDFSFQETGSDNSGIVSVLNSKGKGFVDGIFSGLYEHYEDKYSSLEKIKMVGISVNPMMKKTVNKLGSEAKAEIIFSVEVEGHGVAEFHHKSRSLIYSSFVASLEAFQFYINCEKCFKKLKLILEDAQQRNRGDIMEACLNDLSSLTEVNTYAI